MFRYTALVNIFETRNTNTNDLSHYCNCIASSISGTERETNDSIQAAALSAIVNITNGSDSNRKLTVELNGLRPILEAISSSQSSENVRRGVMALANISFNHNFNADKVVSMDGQMIVLLVLQTCDVS